MQDIRSRPQAHLELVCSFAAPHAAVTLVVRSTCHPMRGELRLDNGCENRPVVDFYPWLKVLHVFLAIVAVDANVTYAIWQARAARSPEHLGWTLRGVKFIDDRVANPAYIGLAVVGVILVLIGPWQFDDLWIAVAIALYVALALIGFGLYTPTLSRQIRVFDADGASAEFASLTSRSRLLGILMGAIVTAIVILMVVKPFA